MPKHLVLSSVGGLLPVGVGQGAGEKGWMDVVNLSWSLGSLAESPANTKSYLST